MSENSVANSEKLQELEKIIYSSSNVVDIIDLVKTTVGKDLTTSSRSEHVNSFDTVLKLLNELRQKSDNDSSKSSSHANDIDDDFCKGLQLHSHKLSILSKQLQNIEQSVGEFSQGASRIGDRLADTDSQIIRITEAKRLLRYYLLLRSYDASTLASAQTLEQSLPPFFLNLTLPDLCLVLNQLRRISVDLCVTTTPLSHSNSSNRQPSQAFIEKQIERAQSNVQLISDSVEQKLLSRFRKCALNIKIAEALDEDTDFSRLYEQKAKDREAHFSLIKRSIKVDDEEGMDVDKLVEMRYLSSLLHQFNNGASLQRRFVCDVVERQLRGQMLDEGHGSSSRDDEDKVRRRASSDDDDDGGRDSSSGGFASDDDDKKPSDATRDVAYKDVSGKTGLLSLVSVSPAAKKTKTNENRGLFSKIFGKKTKEADVVVDVKPKDMVGLQDQLSMLMKEETAVEETKAMIAVNPEEVGLEALQKLSTMFSNISSLCDEQFKVIAVVFSRQAAFRVVRLLVQRILNDPAVGIQTQIEAILDPPMESMQLPLVEFLDALLVVHEKTHSLLKLLRDCCNELSLRCVDDDDDDENVVDGSLIKKKKKRKKRNNKKSPRDVEETKMMNGERNASENTNQTTASSGIDSLNRFVEDQVLTVVRSYREGHFDKEIELLRFRVVSAVKSLVEVDQFSKIFPAITSRQQAAGGISSLMNMDSKASRTFIRRKQSLNLHGDGLSTNQQGLIEGLVSLSSKHVASIPWLMRTVVSQGFINTVTEISKDAISRCKMMDREASEEEQVSHISTIHVILLRFVFDCLLTPSISAAKRLIIGPSNQFPQLEFIHLIKSCHETATFVSYQYFEQFVLPGLPSTAATSLKSLRGTLMKKLDRNVSELFICGIGVLSSCVERYVEKSLTKSCYSAEETKTTNSLISPSRKKPNNGFDSDDENLYQSDDDDGSKSTTKPKRTSKQGSESNEINEMGLFLMLANESENEITRRVAMEIYSFVNTTVSCFSVPNPSRITPFYPLFLRLVEDRILRVILTGICRNLKISEAGGLQLCKDLNLLQASFAKLKHNDIGNMFSKFRELMFLFLAPSDKVELIVRDILGRFTFTFASSEFGLDIKKSDILDLVKRRSDYRVRGIRSAWAKRLFGEDILAMEKMMKQEDESKPISFSNVWDVSRQEIPTVDNDMVYAPDNADNQEEVSDVTSAAMNKSPVQSDAKQSKSLWKKLKNIVGTK